MLLSTTVPLLSARFQSTSPLPRSNVADLATHQSPTSSSTEVWTASSDPLAATTSTSLDHLDFPTTSGGLVSVEPHIGYLKELGLDFGWGPTAIVEWAYEHIHVLAGTPWWGSILITCALYRVLILAYPQLVQSDQMARTAAMKDVMKEPNQRFMDAMKSGNQYEMQTAQAELRQIKSASGISSLKAMWGPIIQGFLGYGTFNLMRSMSNLPVPGLQTGGFLWITDLTVADPFFIMPVALSATMFYLMKGNNENTAAMDAMPTLRNFMVYGIPSITFLVMCSMPACLQLSFMATSVLGMAQGKLLMRDTVRNFLGLYPLYKPQPMPQPAVEDKKTQIKRMRTSQNQGRSVMKGYQPPTVASSVRNLSVKGAPIATATAPQRPGILGGISRFLKTRILNPLGKSSRNMMQEALALRGKASKQETKEEKEKKRRAQDYERRRTREIEEDAKYRRDNVEYKNAR